VGRLIAVLAPVLEELEDDVDNLSFPSPLHLPLRHSPHKT
jgi:hypothetical protein